jgi:endonuclease/exonuclease/phosphatase family metal-dependent hydrolase
LLALGLSAGLAAGTTAGCAQETGSCIPGTIGCICEMSGVCDAGLVCESNRCVSPDDDDDPIAGDTSFGVPSEDGGDATAGSSTTFGAAVDCSGTTLRVASYNVQAVGFAESEGWNALGEVLRRIDADVVCIEELEDGETGPLRELTMALGYGEPVQADASPGIGGEIRNACLGRVPLTRIESFTARDLSSDQFANDVGRDFLAVRAEASEGCHVSMLAVHMKSGLEPLDFFRRQVEHVRLIQAVERVRAEHPDDPVIVMGDFNENIGDPGIGTEFDAPPSGLPASYELGNDIEFPLSYSPFATIQAASLGMVDATHEDSDANGTWSAFDWEGVRLDYLWVPPQPGVLAVDGVVVFNTCLDDGVDAPPDGAWLPLAGDPVPCWVGPAASDHLPIVADLRVP